MYSFFVFCICITLFVYICICILNAQNNYRLFCILKYNGKIQMLWFFHRTSKSLNISRIIDEFRVINYRSTIKLRKYFFRVNNGLYGNNGKKYGELKLFNDVVIHSSFQTESFTSDWIKESRVDIKYRRLAITSMFNKRVPSV